jgi:hypothetical protein
LDERCAVEQQKSRAGNIFLDVNILVRAVPGRRAP